MSFIDFVLGRPDPEGTESPSPGEEGFPHPIAFVEALKAAMRDHLLDITEDRALVPAHYTVLLHAEAYRHFEPAFPVITEAAGEELSKEADRISRTPYGAPLDEAGVSGGQTPPAPPPPVCRDVRPVDTSWSVEFVPVLYSPDGAEVPPGYLAVATRLTAPEAPQVVGDAEEGGLSVTTMNPFSGAYESRPAAAATVRPAEGGGATASVTLRAPFNRPDEAGMGAEPAPPPEAEGSEADPPEVGGAEADLPDIEPLATDALTPDALATLRYTYPWSPDEHVFAVTEPYVTIGRRTPDNESVDLRLDVEVQVSAEHAHLRFDDRAERFEMMDVSSFGTWVDEKPLTRSDPAGGVEHWHPLSDGATINLAGLVFLTFRSAPR